MTLNESLATLFIFSMCIYLFLKMRILANNSMFQHTKNIGNFYREIDRDILHKQKNTHAIDNEHLYQFLFHLLDDYLNKQATKDEVEKSFSFILKNTKFSSQHLKDCLENYFYIPLNINEMYQMILLIYAHKFLPKSLCSSIEYYMDGGSKAALMEQINATEIDNYIKAKLSHYLCLNHFGVNDGYSRR